MYRWMTRLLAGCLLVWESASLADEPPVFRAGAATSNITPELGSPIIGGFAPYPSNHVHDELHARCLVLDDGERQVALVVCDLLGIHRAVSDEARRLTHEATGLPREHVMISATHTHSAASAIENGYQAAPALDAYQQFVARRIADGVRRAMHNLRPAELAHGGVDVPEHVFNRRWYLKPGKMPLNPFGRLDEVKMNPGAGSDDLLDPAGPTDPRVDFLAVRGTDGAPLALFASYSLHYVGGVAGADVSADYFGMFCREMARLLEAEHGDPPFVALLANGTSGDINNISFRVPRPGKPPYEQMKYVAHDVAAKVHQTWSSLAFSAAVRVDARYHEERLQWRKPTAEELAWAKETIATHPETPGQVDLSLVYAQRTLRLNDAPEFVDLPLQVLAIGDRCLATMPCEVFCEIGLEFRERTPLPGNLVSLAHGYYGYLPTPRQHRLGGYETWIGTNRLERDASDKLLDKLLRMTAEIVEGRKGQP